MILILLFIFFIVFGSLAIFKMRFWIFVIYTIMLVLLNLIVFKEEWRSQYLFIKSAIVITGFSIFVFLILFKLFETEIFFKISKLLSVGLVSIVFFLPIIFDQFLRIISISENISSFSEALVLYRNLLNGTANDFVFGLHSSQRIQSFNLINRISRIGLLSITLVSRIPIINDNLLISANIRQFSIQSVKSLFTFKVRNIIIIILLCVISFFIYLAEPI